MKWTGPINKQLLAGGSTHASMLGNSKVKLWLHCCWCIR